MDMLVVVGTSVSYLYSTLALLLACSLPGDQENQPHLFLESPAMLLTFIALGEAYYVMRDYVFVSCSLAQARTREAWEELDGR